MFGGTGGAFRRRWIVGATAAVGLAALATDAGAVAVATAGGVGATGKAAQHGSGKAYSAKVGYIETSSGKPHKGGYIDIDASAKFKQDGIGGTTVEQLLFRGAMKGSTGRSRGMTAACKRVAALKG